MALEITGISLVVEGRNEYLSAIREAQAATRGLGDAASTASGGLTTMSSGGLMKAIAGGNILADVLEKAGGFLLNFGKSAVDNASSLQDTQMQLENLIAAEMVQAGAAKDMTEALGEVGPVAVDTMDKLKSLSLASPFEYKQILSAFMMQKQFGQNTETALDLTKAITNLGAANKSIPGVVERVSYSFGQMNMMGRLGGQEMRELAMAGVDLGKMLREGFGKSVEQVNEDLKSGKMTMADVSQAFVNYVDKYFGTAAERASRSFSGLKSSFNDLAFFSSIDLLGGSLNIVTANLGNLFNKAQTFISNGGLLPIGAGLEVVTQGLFDLGNSAAAAGQDFFDQFGQQMLSTADAAMEWGANIIVQLASGIIEGAGAALTEAMNVVSDMLSWFLAPGSPPNVAPDLPKWGANAIQQFLNGFQDADYGVLNSVGSALQSALSAMVSAGTIDKKAQSGIFQGIQQQLTQALSSGGDITPVLASIRANLGDYGDAVADLTVKQYALSQATEKVLAAENALKAAREAEDKANQALNKSLDEYNALAKAGADPKVLAAKRAEFQQAKKNRDAAHAAGLEAEKSLETSKAEQDELKKKADLQNQLVQSLIALTKQEKEEEKEKGKKKGGRGAGQGAKKPKAGGGFDSKGMRDKLNQEMEKLKADMNKKLADLFAPITDSWNKTVGPLTDAWATFTQTIATLYNQYVAPIVAYLINLIPPDLVKNIGYAAGAYGVLSLALAGLSTIASVVVAVLGTINWPLVVLIGAVALLKTAWDNNWFGMQDTLKAFWPVVQGVLGQVQAIVGQVIGAVIGWFNQNKNVIMGVVITAWKVLQAVVLAVIAALLPVFKTLWTTITTAFTQMSPLIEAFKKLWANLWQLLQPILTLMGVLFVVALDLIVGAIGGIGSALQPFITMIIGVITGIITALAGVVEFVAGFLQLLIGLFTLNGQAIQAAWQRMTDGIASIVAGLGVAVVSLIVGMIDTVVTFLGGFFTTAVNFFKSLYNELVGHSIIPDLVNGIISWFSQLPGKVVTIFTDLVNGAKQVLQDAVAVFQTMGTNIIQGLINGINNAKSAVIDILKNLALEALAAAKKLLGIGSPSSVFADLVGAPIVDGIVQGILSKVKDVGAAIASLFSGAGGPAGTDTQAAVSGTATAVTGTLLPAVQGVGTYITTMFMPVLTNLGTYLSTILTPTLQNLGTYLLAVLLPEMQMINTFIATMFTPAIQLQAQAWSVDLLTALTTVWTFLTGSLHPEYLALGSYLTDIFQPATLAMNDAWGVGLLTAFTNVWTYLTTSLHPSFLAFQKFFQEIFTVGVKYVALDLFPKWTDAMLTLNDALWKVREAISRVAAALKGLRIPPWATPGSPTPFEIGIRGMTEAMQELRRYGVVKLQNELGAMERKEHGGSPADALAARLSLAVPPSGGVSETRNYNLTMNTRMEPQTVRQGFEAYRLLGA